MFLGLSSSPIPRYVWLVYFACLSGAKTSCSSIADRDAGAVRRIQWICVSADFRLLQASDWLVAVLSAILGCPLARMKTELREFL